MNGLVAQGITLGFMSELLALPTQQQLGAALASLTPAGESASHSSAMTTGATFAGHLQSCRVAGEGDEHAVIREGQCIWARTTARRLGLDAGQDGQAMQERSLLYTGGVQFDLGGPWRLGTGLGYETSNSRIASGARTDTERIHAGVIIKYNPGPLFLSGGITGGYGWSDNRRPVLFGAFSATATSESQSAFAAARLTAAYQFNFGSWYAKPQVDFALTGLHRDAFVETGSGGIALAVRQSNDKVFTASPLLELGTQFGISDFGVARPFVRAGFTWRDKDTFATTASFAEASSELSRFTIQTKVDKVVGDVGAGIDVVGRGDTALRIL